MSCTVSGTGAPLACSLAAPQLPWRTKVVTLIGAIE